MMMFRWFVWQTIGWVGWALCEAAFKTDCWGPFAWCYRTGCAVYDAETNYGEHHGFLIQNPKFGEPDQPQLIEKPRVAHW